MKFSELAIFFQKLENTPSRNSMTEILAGLFKKSDVSEIDKISYLTQGRIAPLFIPLEFGVADKMAMRAIAQACGVGNDKVLRLFKKIGDLGKAAEQLKESKHKTKNNDLSVSEAFLILEKVAKSAGVGSQEEKVKLLADLLKSVDSLSARYIIRIPLGRLRLGFSDMTVLDALSWLTSGGKTARPEIEKAYNVRPDLGFISKTIKGKGLSGLSKVSPVPGTPILMARAERLSSAKEIIEKIGQCAVEPKLDGFRLQVHYNKNLKFQISNFKSTNEKLFDQEEEHVRLYTRNLEDVTTMYPDIVASVNEQIKANEAIFEGEAIAYNPDTGEYLPFQETVQRKRKYHIEEMTKTVPLKLICFDLLYLDGKNFIHEPYLKRRETLEKIVTDGKKTILVSEKSIVEKPDDLEKIFQDAISRGLEGIMAKRLEGVYQAGARGWNWIKYKRSYAGKLEDTMDAIVMGYDFGQGKRTGFGIGAFLIGVYDKKSDTFKTVAKIGTGLTDKEWKTLKVHSKQYTVNSKPKRYDVDKAMECDVWVTPSMVVVIRADEITRSPVHTAGRIMGLTKSGGGEEVKTPGFALRFPRLENFRDDKTPEDSTSLKEIEEMYKMQGKR